MATAPLRAKLDSLRHIIENIDLLCLPTHEIQLELGQIAKCFFDYSVENGKEFGDIAELIVQNIDSDSIWEQIQTRDRPLIRYIQSNTEELRKRTLNQKVEILEELQDDDSENVEDGEESMMMQSDQESDINLEESSRSDPSFESEDQDEDPDLGEDEMEKFLDEIDMVEEKRLAKLENPNREPDQEENLEYEDDLDFASRELYDLPTDDDEIDNNIRYHDFFGPQKSKPDSGDSDVEYEEHSDDEDFDASGDESEDESVEEDRSKEKSTTLIETSHSKQKKKMQDRIAEMEQQLIEPKSWDLKGEVASRERPENSLLGLAVSIDRASKSVPIVTPEYSKSIEDMIIDRIKASNFSNIIIQKTLEKSEARESAELSQEKSGQGLGELYAEQFLKESLHFDKTEDKLQEVREKVLLQFKKVCRQLDGLSHFHFTPKPETSEFGVKALAVSAISMEDVLPTTQRTATVYSSSLAPEQIYEKKRGRDAAFLSSSEADRDDRQRLRRAKKASRNRIRKAQALESGNLDVSLKKDKRVVVADDSSTQTKSFSKSANFFSQMQQNVKQNIVRGKEPSRVVDGGSLQSSHKFKL